MTGNKRQRELARAKYERQQAKRAQSAVRRRKQQRIIAVVVVAAVVIGAGVWVALGRNSTDTPVATPTTSASAAVSASASPSASGSAAASAQASASAGASDPASVEPAILDCSAPGTPRADDKTYDTYAASTPTPSTLTLATNCGDIVIALDPAAPATVASAAFLAQDGFYDNTACHRLTTAGIYVLQCGDPKGDGTGGPGYVLPDENLPAAGENNYPAGTVAMANAGSGTAGSQFFIVYQDSTLDPAIYTVWGTVTSGLDMVQEVASVGVAGGGTDGAPQQPVFIESATVQP